VRLVTLLTCVYSSGQHQEPQHRPAAEPDQRPPEDVGGGHLQGRSGRQLLGQGFDAIYEVSQVIYLFQLN
jgi:hypothetical protein